MYQLSNFGSTSFNFKKSDDRYIDSDNDTYPPPLTNLPSIKVTGFDRLFYAMMYFKIGRVRELLIQVQKPDNNLDFTIFDKGYYGYNLIYLIIQPNFTTNINYHNNKTLYEDLFFVVLKNLKPENLNKLFDDLSKCSILEIPQIHDVFKVLSDRPHMLLALWNYGLKYDEKCIEKLEYEPLKCFFKKYLNKEFIPGKRYYLLSNKCPISLQTIDKPTLLPSGHMFEYSKIKKHLLTSNNNPMTGELLVCKSQSYFTEKYGKWIAKIMPIKVLYFPESNRFEHVLF